jgi:hypothetical protein
VWQLWGSSQHLHGIEAFSSDCSVVDGEPVLQWCVAPAILPQPAAGPTLPVARLTGLISLPTWLCAALPLRPGWALGLSVLVTATEAAVWISSGLCFSGSQRRAVGTEDG